MANDEELIDSTEILSELQKRVPQTIRPYMASQSGKPLNVKQLQPGSNSFTEFDGVALRQHFKFDHEDLKVAMDCLEEHGLIVRELLKWILGGDCITVQTVDKETIAVLTAIRSIKVTYPYSPNQSTYFAPDAPDDDRSVGGGSDFGVDG